MTFPNTGDLILIEKQWFLRKINHNFNLNAKLINENYITYVLNRTVSQWKGSDKKFHSEYIFDLILLLEKGSSKHSFYCTSLELQALLKVDRLWTVIKKKK